ncbi:hypothetical protein J6590_006163 [Homalodisca vitripennis]|nr:hypothetical protein J6590_006163 [Homalodisca vitripennis]
MVEDAMSTCRNPVKTTWDIINSSISSIFLRRDPEVCELEVAGQTIRGPSEIASCDHKGGSTDTNSMAEPPRRKSIVANCGGMSPAWLTRVQRNDWRPDRAIKHPPQPARGTRKHGGNEEMEENLD